MILIFKLYDFDILLSDIKNSLAKPKNLKSRSNVPKISFLQVFLTKTAYFCDYLQFKENKKNGHRNHLLFLLMNNRSLKNDRISRALEILMIEFLRFLIKVTKKVRLFLIAC